MQIVIATTQVPFVRGGAEVHAENLRIALCAAGHNAEIVAIPYKWYPPEQIIDTMLACRLLDLEEANGKKIDLLIGLKFPAYLIKHPNKVLWILHQHRTAYETWDRQYGDIADYPNAQEVRAAIHSADRRLIPEAKRVYANSRNVASRLIRYCGVDATPLYHPPLNAERFRCEAAENYLLYPSRIVQVKRQLLAVQALGRTRSNVSLILCGEIEQPHYEQLLRQEIAKLGLEARVRFVGRVSEEEKLELYARALAVLYPPFDEDYGYVTLEAMLSSKPLITCADSGGPLEFVSEGVTGFIAAPEPGAIADVIDRLAADAAMAAKFGRAAADQYAKMDISWESAVAKLTL